MNPNFLIFSDNQSVSLDIVRILEVVREYYPDVEYAGDLKKYVDTDDYRKFCERIRVKDSETPLENPGITEEVSSERINTVGKPLPELHDGYWLQRKLNLLVKNGLTGDDFNKIHIVLTGLLFGTFGDNRYHARTVLMGEPNLLSTPGIVEGPARPPEYYWIKAGFIHSGRDPAEIDEVYRDRYLVHDDERLTEIAASYVLQIVAYSLTGVAFCDNHECCLYNSHWQKEVLDLQFNHKMCDGCLEKFKKHQNK